MPIPIQPQNPPAYIPNPILPPAPPVQIPQLNWSYFKPEFSGKPEEDVEAHLLRTNDWVETHNFPELAKVQRFCLALTSEARLWYETLRPKVEYWTGLQATTPFMKVGDVHHSNKTVSFNTHDLVREQLESLTSMVYNMSMHMEDNNRPFKPQIHQKKRRGQNKENFVSIGFSSCLYMN